MSSDIRPAGVATKPDIRESSGDTNDNSQVSRHLVPMSVGTATVYIEQVGTPPTVIGKAASGKSDIRPVAVTPEQAFKKAGEVVQECVRVVGEGMGSLRTAAKTAIPDELTVEFSLTFEATSEQSIIPIFVTTEQKINTGLKITAKWKPGPESSG